MIVTRVPVNANELQHAQHGQDLRAVEQNLQKNATIKKVEALRFAPNQVDQPPNKD